MSRWVNNMVIVLILNYVGPENESIKIFEDGTIASIDYTSPDPIRKVVTRGNVTTIFTDTTIRYQVPNPNVAIEHLCGVRSDLEDYFDNVAPGNGKPEDYQYCERTLGCVVEAIDQLTEKYDLD